jgi:hypothetical protein
MAFSLARFRGRPARPRQKEKSSLGARGALPSRCSGHVCLCLCRSYSISAADAGRRRARARLADAGKRGRQKCEHGRP